MPFIRFGVKSDYFGRNLWDIILTQPKLAVGRIVLQNHLKDFPEPSFIKLVKVEAKMSEFREMSGKIIGERWHRGNYCGVEDMIRIARFQNFTLVPKTEEEKLWERLKTCKKPDVVVLPSTVALPPVFKMFLEQQHKMSIDRYPLHLDPNMPDNFYVRVAEEGEKPTVPNEEVDGLGTTSQPHLYEGVPLEKATIPPPKNSVRIPTIDITRIDERPVKVVEEPITMAN